MKPICVKCQKFYKPKKNGFRFTEMMPVNGPDWDQGTWRPYKVWDGDLWECKGCGHEIVVGCGLEALSEHYMPDFHDYQKMSQLEVNDC